jgi:enhancer of polycomb-like protein
VHYRLEVLLFKLEILDHKAREKAGIITLTIVGSVPVILQFNSAMEVIFLSIVKKNPLVLLL